MVLRDLLFPHPGNLIELWGIYPEAQTQRKTPIPDMPLNPPLWLFAKTLLYLRSFYSYVEIPFFRRILAFLFPMEHSGVVAQVRLILYGSPVF